MSRASSRDIVSHILKISRKLEQAVKKGPLSRADRDRFQVVALIARSQKQKLKTTGEERKFTEPKLDQVGSALAKIAIRDASLIGLLESTAPSTHQASNMLRQIVGVFAQKQREDNPDALSCTIEPITPSRQDSYQIPDMAQLSPSVISKMRSDPFCAPGHLRPIIPNSNFWRLKSWDLLGEVLKAFEAPVVQGAACMAMPEQTFVPKVSESGIPFLRYQMQFLELVRRGKRRFLLADEPGLGKTAQALMAASIARAFPLLCIVPNIVKTNWKEEAQKWIPSKKVSVLCADPQSVNAHADIYIVNYEILDRHLSWIFSVRPAGIVLDEAHFIKNFASQRSKAVIALADTVRYGKHGSSALLIALTGTPIINQVEDFLAIWRFLGWVEQSKALDAGADSKKLVPSTLFMQALSLNNLVPSDPGFLQAARSSVIDFGFVRRRKVDVAHSIPPKRIVNVPIELEDARDIQKAQNALIKRLVERYQKAVATRKLSTRQLHEDILLDVARREANSGLDDKHGIFKLLHEIGVKKAPLCAEYCAQLAHSVGKVVYFAKHIKAISAAERVFRDLGLQYVSIVGGMSAKERDTAQKRFFADKDCSIAICSLLAAGVGINLQIASNIVLAELSWTFAEQTQAIDRVHRHGQQTPVTAWRVVASRTLDTHVADIVDGKASLVQVGLDGAKIDENTMSPNTSSAQNTAAWQQESVQTQTLARLMLEMLNK